MDKEYAKLLGKTMLAVIVLCALIATLAAVVGRQVEKCAKELDDNGGLKAVAERAWNGKGDEYAERRR